MNAAHTYYNIVYKSLQILCFDLQLSVMYETETKLMFRLY